jgi:NAD(P)H dehydrogenase (quinone)
MLSMDAKPCAACHDALMEPTRGERIGHTDLAGDLGRRVAMRLAGHGVEAVEGLKGVATMLLVPVRERADRVEVHASLVDRALAAGVRHIVYVSFLNTSAAATFTLARDHYATEQYIRRSGAGFTFLRASAFHEVAHYLLGSDDVIRGPAGRGRVAFVSKDDVADVAATVLMDAPAHAGATYDLTGPRAVSLYELADLFTQTAGRRIAYLEETVEAAYQSRAAYGVPQWQLDAWVSTYLQIGSGELDIVASGVERVLGRPPISLEHYLAGHSEVLAPRD